MQFLKRYSYIWKFEGETENKYELFVRSSNLTSLRLVCFITIFGMLLFLLIDFFKEVDYSIVLGTRILVLTGASLIMWFSYRPINARGIAFSVVMIVLLNFGASLTTATYAGMPSFYITNLLFLIFVLVVTASGLHFRHALIINFFCLAVFILYAQFVNRNPFYVSQYPHLVSIFVYIHIVGIVLEKRRRTNFLQFNDLVEQKRLVEELNQQKNKVISILSHDVATPMSSLSKILYLQTHGKISEAHLKPFMNGLTKEINNVSFLLNGLVRWSRSQMQGFVLNKSAVNVKELIEAKAELFQLQLSDKNLQMDIRVPQTAIVYMDEEMIGIALRNIISNGIKFANTNSTITVEVGDDGFDKVKILIANEGKPIPSNHRDKLFTYQMPAAEDTSGERGAGLGLAMAAFFVRLHGGEIQLISSTEKSTVFCVVLPIRAGKLASV